MDRPRVFRALGAAHIVRAILLLVIAALLAYALAPGVKLLQRVMPRFLAILIMYLIVLGAVSFLLYLIITTAIDQIGSLTITVQKLLTPGSGRQLSPIEQALSTLVVSIMSMYHTLIISTFASGVLFSLCLIFDSISVLGLFSLKQRVERRVS
ncbi:MAG: AI-2E family transporter [Ktedonobacteraceae bacterium]|nr:AI-2E family transporter [Ktedonobacteraceae bacterium]